MEILVKMEIIINFISAMIGGFIGGFFTWLATTKTLKHQIQERRTVEKEQLMGVLKSIYTEINAIYNALIDSIDEKEKQLKAEQKPCLFYYYIESNYFTIYESSASFLGQLDNNDLRNDIVETYILAKRLIDSFKLNNSYYSEYEKNENLYQKTRNDKASINQYYKNRKEICYENLKGYSKKLRSGIEEFKFKCNNLLPELKSKIK